ncbi:hypothetical protein MUA03_04215 [Enterobacteriaceae bacterium H16N7]|nr:hypothetical protein [Dryocola clanedunensis]
MDVKNIADMLKAFSEQEKEKINQQNITHAPTIGLMYEGLTKNLFLNDLFMRSFPPVLDLKICRGFFYSDSDNNKLSNQIDCMLVQGEGEKLPNIDEYKYNIKNVIAILEVKKNLFLSELKDSLNLLEKTDSFFNLTTSLSSLNFSMINRSFEKITNKKAPHFNEIDLLDEHDYAVYQALASDQLAPVRIAIGYEGYKNEMGLRKGFIKHFSNIKKFRVFKIPSLIISDNYSVVKINGFPYYLTTQNIDEWVVAASCNCNPLILLLEVIFDKIQQRFGVDLDLDEVLIDENTYPLLSIIKKDGKWDAYPIEEKLTFFENRAPYLSWNPVPIDEDEMSLLRKLESCSFYTQDDIYRLKSTSDKAEGLISKLIRERYFIHADNGISKCSSFIFAKLNSGGYLLFPNEKKMQQWIKHNYTPSN